MIDLRTSTLDPFYDERIERVNTTRRQLQSSSGVIEANLARFMKFDLIRGNRDSPDISRFKFSVQIDKFTEAALVLSFDFVYPLSISMGSSPDIMRITVTDPSIFISKATGKTLVGGVVSENEIPRQFVSPESSVRLEQSGKAIEVSYQASGGLTLFATFFLGISLKPLWNFKNAM